MNDWITSNPEILNGKPVVRGTRLSVSFLLGLLNQGWSETQILESYPHLPLEGLQAAIQHARETKTSPQTMSPL
jgi:uncharacterized protein (DUF433 family)